MSSMRVRSCTVVGSPVVVGSVKFTEQPNPTQDAVIGSPSSPTPLSSSAKPCSSLLRFEFELELLEVLLPLA